MLSLGRSNPVPSRSARLQSELFFEKGGAAHIAKERDGLLTDWVALNSLQDEKASVLHSRVAFVPTSRLRRGLPSSASATPATAVDIVALDCELVYTTAGMSLARVTVLSGSGSVLLDEHVRPPTGVAIVDLNTRFSGVQERDLDKAVLDVGGVQRALAQFVDAETIFVGHGLENDLKALRLVHTRVIDTAIVSRSLLPFPKHLRWRGCGGLILLSPRLASFSHTRTAARGDTRSGTSPKTSSAR